MRRTRSIGSGYDATSNTVQPSVTAPPVSKRQRLMMDQFDSAFESMSLSQNNDNKLPANNNAEHEHSSYVVQASLSSDTDDDDEMSDSLDPQQRKIMYQLALGKPSSTANTVDQRLESMIRQSRLQTLSQPLQYRARDDFGVETSYSRANIQHSTNNTRQRSNSLPQDWEAKQQQDGSSMDVDMMM